MFLSFPSNSQDLHSFKKKLYLQITQNGVILHGCTLSFKVKMKGIGTEFCFWSLIWAIRALECLLAIICASNLTMNVALYDVTKGTDISPTHSKDECKKSLRLTEATQAKFV